MWVEMLRSAAALNNVPARAAFCDHLFSSHAKAKYSAHLSAQMRPEQRACATNWTNPCAPSFREG
jgi:hypothetical protein